MPGEDNIPTVNPLIAHKLKEKIIPETGSEMDKLHRTLMERRAKEDTSQTGLEQIELQLTQSHSSIYPSIFRQKTTMRSDNVERKEAADCTSTTMSANQ